jgi:hypothetical protein
VSKRSGGVTRETRPTPRGDVLPARTAPTPLPRAERAFFESRLGQDFSRVRLHTDDGAAAAAAGLRAKAFTVGNDIAFAAGRYRPETPAGRRLLAHELVHVAQQGRAGAGAGAGSHAAAEARAGAAAERVAGGQAASPALQGSAAPGLYCDPDDEKKKLDDAAAPPAPAPAAALAPAGGGAAGSGGSGPARAPWFQMPTLVSPPGVSPSLPPSPSPLLAPPAPAPFGVPQPGPIVPPYKLMANADILAPFSAYGTTPGSAGMDIHGDWARAYFTFRNYMPESLAVTSANMFLPAAYQAALAFDKPSIFDKSDQDFKAAHPDDKRLPPIPLVSSGTLTKLYEAITKKKDTNAFYF